MNTLRKIVKFLTAMLRMLGLLTSILRKKTDRHGSGCHRHDNDNPDVSNDGNDGDNDSNGNDGDADA